MRSLRRVAPVLALTAVLAACGGSPSGAPVADVSLAADDGLNGVVLPTPYDVPHVRLTDTAGAPYTLDSDSTAPVTLVFFGYTSCPDICGVVLANLTSALNRLAPADRAKVDVLFVTTDPARDDPRTLRAYLDRFDPGFEGLTGPLSRLVAAGEALGVPFERGGRLPSGGYEVAHGTQVDGVLPDGTAPVVWTGSRSAEEIADDLTTIIHHGVPETGSR
ncbi:MAG: SCO family protein [Nocardioidaceae bacterium]